MSSVYKEEVLGKHCAIAFQVAGTGNKKLQFYPGRVTKYRRTVDVDAREESERITHEHYVVFDDEDEVWFDLKERKSLGHLKWLHRAEQDEDEEPEKEQAEDEVVPDEAASFSPNGHRSKQITLTSNPHLAQSATPPAQAATPKKRKKAQSKAAVVTPDKKKKATDQKMAKPDPNAPAWINEMLEWMQTEPHGQKKTTVSATNAKSVVRQIKKLASGQGIGYKRWPDDCIFYQNQAIDLYTTDFDAMMEEARDFEDKYGEDTGHGWLLRHPIKKLKLYQKHVLAGIPGLDESDDDE